MGVGAGRRRYLRRRPLTYCGGARRSGIERSADQIENCGAFARFWKSTNRNDSRNGNAMASVADVSTVAPQLAPQSRFESCWCALTVRQGVVLKTSPWSRLTCSVAVLYYADDLAGFHL